MKIELKTRDYVVEHWPVLSAFLHLAHEKGQGETSLTDYLMKILNCQAQCWVVEEKDQIVGVGLSQILHYTQHKTLHLIDFSGKSDAVTPEILSVVEEFALKHDCIALEQWGRRGWARMLPQKVPGFYEAYTVMRKDLGRKEQ
jgi:hypothetical protein